jgi:hypothetical protein
VAGAADLPGPEPLSAAAAKDAGPLIDLFGAYVAQCFYSRTWSLREAAVRKMALELPRIAASGAASPSALFAAGASVATLVTARDKIAHVFVAVATQLLPALLSAANLRRGEATGSIEGLMVGLVEKLGDNTPRVRDAAMSALVTVSGEWERAAPCEETSGVVSAVLLRPRTEGSSLHFI